MSHPFQTSCFLALGLLLSSGCELSLSRVPVAQQDASASRARDSGELRDAQAAADGGGEQAPPPKDAGTPDADAGSPEAVQHPSCSERAPATLPFVTVPSDARGRPLFDLFRDYACTDKGVASYPTCQSFDGTSEPACPACFGAGTSADSLCVTKDARVDGCLMLTTLDGTCSACVAAEAKAKACCLGLSVDCRPWPFDGSSAPGQLCAAHSDCNPGLVCKVDARRDARCVCPESSLSAEPEPATCSPGRVSK